MLCMDHASMQCRKKCFMTQQLARSRQAQLLFVAADGEHHFDGVCGSHTWGCRTDVRQIGGRSTALEWTLGTESNPNRGDCNYFLGW